MTVTDITKKFSRTPSRTERAARILPLVIGGVRAGLGAGYLLAPTLSHRLIGGDDAALPTLRSSSRLFGAREIYVGAGVLAATKSTPAILRNAIGAGVVLDTVDALAFAATAGTPTRGRIVGTVAAAGFAVLGTYTALLLTD